MPFVAAGQNAMLSGGLGNAITHISAHTAIPDSTGNAEIVGGSYARVPVTWSAPSSGVRSNSAQLTLEIPAATTLVAVGFWSASSGGTYYGWAPVNPTIKGFGLVGSGGVTSDQLTSIAHGLANGDRLFILAAGGSPLVGGLSSSTLYHVVGAGTDTYSVALTSGGAAVNLTSTGEFFHQTCVPEVYGAAGQYVIPTGDLDLDMTLV